MIDQISNSPTDQMTVWLTEQQRNINELTKYDHKMANKLIKYLSNSATDKLTKWLTGKRDRLFDWLIDQHITWWGFGLSIKIEITTNFCKLLYF